MIFDMKTTPLSQYVSQILESFEIHVKDHKASQINKKYYEWNLWTGIKSRVH